MVKVLVIVYINKESHMDFIDKFIILVNIGLENTLMVKKRALQKDIIQMET